MVDPDILAEVKAGRTEWTVDVRPIQNDLRRKHERVRCAWIEFCNDVGEPVRQIEPHPWNPIPDVHLIQAFLKQQSRDRKGILDSKISTKTLNNTWDILRRDITAHTGYRYTAEAQIRITETIWKQLPQTEGVSTKTRPKPLADHLVIRDVIIFLWKHDAYEINPRMRIQLAFSLLLMHYTGLRPGSFVECSSYRRSNEGLHWKDVKFLFVPGADGAGVFEVILSIRNDKNNRGSDNCPPKRLSENRNLRARCPVSLLLAMALADGALSQISEPRELEKIRFDPARSTRILDTRAELADVPVLRRNKLGAPLQTSETKIMTAGNLATLFTELGHRAGYKENLGTYAVRRGFANAIDKKVTSAERNMALGHNHSATFLAYASLIPAADLQKIASGEQPDQTMTDFLRSMRAHVDTAAPIKHQSSLRDRRYRPPEQQSTSYQQARKNYFLQKADNVFEGTPMHIPAGQSMIRETQSPEFQTYLKYDIQRSAVLAILYPQQERAVHIADTVEALVRTMENNEWFYPNTKPTGNGCRCGSMLPNGDAQVKLHLLHCYRQERATTAPGAVFEFCYQCSQYFDGIDAWTGHCHWHLDNLDMHCGQVCRRAITLRAGYCAFCLGNEKLPSAARFRQFTSSGNLNQHLEGHILQVQTSTAWQCPHPLCSAELLSNQDFWNHQANAHGLNSPQSRRGTETSKPNKDTAISEPAPAILCLALHCDYESQCVEQFIVHSRTHPNKKCPVDGCDFSCRTLLTYRRHLAGQHGLSIHKCNLESLIHPNTTCDRAFDRRPHLLVHQKSHERKHLLRCKIEGCARTFLKRGTLERHVLLYHLGKTPYNCSECGKGWRSNRHLQRHKCRAANSDGVSSGEGEEEAEMTEEDTEIERDSTCSDSDAPFEDEDDESSLTSLRSLSKEKLQLYPCYEAASAAACDQTSSMPASQEVVESFQRAWTKPPSVEEVMQRGNTVVTPDLCPREIGPDVKLSRPPRAPTLPFDSTFTIQLYSVDDDSRVLRQCPQGCGTVMARWRALREHLISTHSKSPFICRWSTTVNSERIACAEALADSQSLQAHEEGHKRWGSKIQRQTFGHLRIENLHSADLSTIFRCDLIEV